MEICNNHIHPPRLLNELGMRAKNEDSIYPENVTTEQRLFMVCDGVGGQNKGEVASALVCNYFAKYINQNKQNSITKEFFELGLVYVEEKMKDHINKHLECSEMATTLTLLYFSSSYKMAHIVWVGDSRIYHIRDGKILFQTKDHSEVQSLVDMGEITKEEAQTHPRRNVITRAISSSSNPTRIDYKEINEIHPNDFFLLSSDGILENLDEHNIEAWFKKESASEEIKAKIAENALGKTKDNYSMYLIKIK